MVTVLETPVQSGFNIMWKTFADDCQFFDVFAAFVLSFIGFNFYFCLTASEEKRKHGFQKTGIPNIFTTEY